jgi:3-methyladenine DNA glycosylase/8-oxoguanine DNA glycosylase
MKIEELRGMGFSHQKAGYLTGLARAITGEQFNLEEIEMLDDKEAVAVCAV